MTRRSDPRTSRQIVPRDQLPDFEPVPLKPRSDGWTPDRQREFIEALADTGSVDAACKAVDMSTVGAYRIPRLPEATSFAKAWEAALDLGVRLLEDIAMERALNGVEEPFYVYGNHVGTRRKYNDRLLMFMLRNRAPERFGNSVTQGGGSLKGLNAIGKMEKKRLKAKWRKQWEKKQRRVSPQKVRASIDAKIEAIRAECEVSRRREWEQMSDDTRAAWERYVELRDADFERLQADEHRRRRHREGPDVNESWTTPDEKKPPEVKKPKTVHRLKDDGWE